MKSKSYLLIPLLAVLLTAFASNAKPVSLSEKRYSMSFTMKDGVEKDAEAFTDLIDILQGFCKKKGKELKFIETEDNGMPVLDPKTNQFTFECVENG